MNRQLGRIVGRRLSCRVDVVLLKGVPFLIMWEMGGDVIFFSTVIKLVGGNIYYFSGFLYVSLFSDKDSIQ